MKKMFWFTSGACLSLFLGIFAFYTMYQQTEFPVQHVSGKDSLLQDRTIQLHFTTMESEIYVDITNGVNSKTISNDTADTRVSQVHENFQFDEVDAGEWKESLDYSATEGVKQMERTLHKVKVAYDLMFDDSSLSYHLDTGLIDYSNESYEIKQTKMVMEDDPVGHDDEPMRVEKESTQIHHLQNLARYCDDTYYFVPKTSSHMEGDVYLYRLTIKDHKVISETIANLDHKEEVVGCYVIENRILVIAKDRTSFYVTLYDTAGKKLKEANITPDQMVIDEIFVNDQYVIWYHDQTAYVLDCDTMELIAKETMQVDQSLYQDIVRPELAYRNEMLWITGMKSKEGSYRTISIVAQKHDEILYEGELPFIKTGWTNPWTIQEVPMVDVTIQ